MSRCIWITGLPGAGKTTLGHAVKGKLKARGAPHVLLDGDAMRMVLGAENLGYDTQSRKELAMVYARLCREISGQGIYVVCCTVSMFDSVRRWNRENIAGYVEVFLDTAPEVLSQRDQKGLYSSNNLTLPGVSQTVELPKYPDFRLSLSQINEIEEAAEKILSGTLI